jgi:hypothetical protein
MIFKRPEPSPQKNKYVQEVYSQGPEQSGCAGKSACVPTSGMDATVNTMDLAIMHYFS